MLNLQTYFFQWSTWLYDLSYHQGIILTSMIQLSGFTYVTQVPNQVGLHILTQLPNQVGLQIWLKYPTRWVYTFEQVLTWLNITILHHRSQHDLFIKLQIWLFIIKIKESQSWYQITTNQENANNASFPHEQFSPLACASWTLSTANHQGIFINNIKEWNKIMRTGTSPEIPNNTATVLKILTQKIVPANTHTWFSVYKLAYIRDYPSGNPCIQFNILYLSRSDLLRGRDNSQLLSEIFKCFLG